MAPGDPGEPAHRKDRSFRRPSWPRHRAASRSLNHPHHRSGSAAEVDPGDHPSAILPHVAHPVCSRAAGSLRRQPAHSGGLRPDIGGVARGRGADADDLSGSIDVVGPAIGAAQSPKLTRATCGVPDHRPLAASGLRTGAAHHAHVAYEVADGIPAPYGSRALIDLRNLPLPRYPRPAHRESVAGRCQCREAANKGAVGIHGAGRRECSCGEGRKILYAAAWSPDRGFRW